MKYAQVRIDENWFMERPEFGFQPLDICPLPFVLAMRRWRLGETDEAASMFMEALNEISNPPRILATWHGISGNDGI